MATERPEYNLVEIASHYRSSSTWIIRYLIELEINPSYYLLSYEDPKSKFLNYIKVNTWVKIDMLQFSEFLSSEPKFIFAKFPLLKGNYQDAEGSNIEFIIKPPSFEIFEQLYLTVKDLKKLHKAIISKISELPKSKQKTKSSLELSPSNISALIKLVNSYLAGLPILKKNKLLTKSKKLKVSEIIRQLMENKNRQILKDAKLEHLSENSLRRALNAQRAKIKI